MTKSVLQLTLTLLLCACFSHAQFASKLYPALENADCRSCHNQDGVSSATRLVFPPPEAAPAAIEAFGLELSRLVDRVTPENSLLLRKPTARAPHAGGERIKKGSPDEQLLREWVTHLAKTPEPELRAALARLTLRKTGGPHATLRRLTHSQYNNTVRDLLGDFTRPADQFPQEDFLHGFTNQAEGQSIPPLLAEAYTTAAEKLAATAYKRGDPCKAIACREKFVRTFGLRAFRRPLTAGELKGYAGLYARGGAKLVVEAMLQSPNFLFHLADGQYGVAGRLSYFLWDTMPSDELLRAAAAGEFKDGEAIRKTARRMMDDPRARRTLDRFLAQWMRFDRVLGSSRSVRRYPDFGPSLLAAMTEETRHLFNHLVWNDGNFMEMFDAKYTFLSARLAQLYDLPAPATDFGMVMYPAGTPRAGVFGHAGFLTLASNPNETSPTSRGVFVREQFLCQQVPPPPPGTDTTLPAVNAEKPMTTRERLGVHTTNQSCAGCHSLVDPIGFGLEGFDNIGRSRDKFVIRTQQERDAVTNERREGKTVELKLDTGGSIQGIPNSKFSTAAELGGILAKDPTCQRCVVKQVFRYANGRHETAADRDEIERLYERFRASGFRFRDLLLDVVIKSD